MLLIVVIIAGVVVLLSFHNTAKLADLLGLSPVLTAGLVEILFASLLFLRGRQKATQRNVPPFLEWGYFGALALVTGVNMWGLAQEHMIIGPIVGLAISGAMWLMESTLVWLWTESDRPHRKTAREMMREAKREIKEEKAIQRIEWMKWEARKPDLSLIRKARAAEEKRREVVGDGLPEYFTQKVEPVKEVTAEIIALPEPVPVKRQIGFRMDPEPVPTSKAKPAPRFQPNLEARAKAIQVAKELQAELGRIPKKGELMARGISDHYSRIAIRALKDEQQ